MAVELAVLIPVIVVVALIVYNLASFATRCASFDRVACQAITSVGVSGNNAGTRSVAEGVRLAILQTLDENRNGSWDVEVTCSREAPLVQSGVLSLCPALNRFTCTFVMKPWPSSFVMAGVAFEPPLALRHECSLVVDGAGRGSSDETCAVQDNGRP